MAYSYTNKKGVSYILHYKDVTLKGGREQRIYFFSKTVSDKPGAVALDEVPAGYKVEESDRTGLPFLKKA